MRKLYIEESDTYARPRTGYGEGVGGRFCWRRVMIRVLRDELGVVLTGRSVKSAECSACGQTSDAKVAVHPVGGVFPHGIGHHLVLVDGIGVHAAISTSPIGLRLDICPPTSARCLPRILVSLLTCGTAACQPIICVGNGAFRETTAVQPT